jgi:hypothetical protein
MPFVPIDECCKLELLMTWDTQQIENVFHYTKVGNYTIDDLADLALAFRTAWNLGPRGSMSNTVSARGLRLTDLSTSTGPVIEYVTGFPLTGALSATASLPNNVAICMTKRTPARGRSHRGRTYHPGLVEGDVVGNAVAAARVTDLLSSYNSLIELVDANTITHTLVVASTFANGDWRPEGIVTPVIAYTTDGMVDSMRRRLPGRGG